MARDIHYDDSIDNIDSLSIYLNEISKIPLLSTQEEVEVCKNIEKYTTKSREIEEKFANNEISYQLYEIQIDDVKERLEHYKNKLIRANLRLVVSVAKKYRNRGVPLQDLIDEGNIGVIKAIKRFDYTKGYKFSTYATWWIKQEILKSVANNGRIIRLPIHVFNDMQKCYYVAQRVEEISGNSASPAQVSRITGISEEKVQDIFMSTQEILSLDIPVNKDAYTEFSEIIADETTKNPLEEVFINTLHSTIEDMFECLTKREKQIIQLRYGFEGRRTHTLEETGKILDLSRERVRQIQNKALRKLKNISISKQLEDFNIK